MYYTTVREFKYAQFDIIIDWAHEHFSVRDMFEETEERYAEMEERLEYGYDTHFITRVRAMYDGVMMGCAHLGSCYASGCEPNDDILDGLYGHLEDMIEEAVDQAQDEAVRMLDRLQEDFLK